MGRYIPGIDTFTLYNEYFSLNDADYNDEDEDILLPDDDEGLCDEDE